MLDDLTRIAEKRLDGKPRIIKDESLKGKSYGVMIKGSRVIRVSPAVYGLLFAERGEEAQDYDAVSRVLDIKIVKRTSRKK